ncbi:16S rRNA (guanine(966)-N(2))-methyltransferase RsmD [Alkalibacterium olivapovliticus]|uniref:16S rRNA (Guanine966-N2)-methyltransferase n=1 Tax=Alkalibacterium olivapovliticus TaxID=99907 RepID=A0A2T0WAZ2_9LACT|nr:16S rRNA (guanine(966)-N(2))-methyltransferase RsmD [Alkalibacterium olivapovliticus]PRY83880.1 16S rRNA (guanine966-N2)-methyltransferase [Alkalibacterium olivapovliticus]
MRVISGEYGGRTLKSLKGTTTRPTTDKVKEAVFHIIGPYFDGGTVLDLYSGSGSLGIEAVSRGMSTAYLVDKNGEAISVIDENIRMTKEESKFVVWRKTDHQALAELKRTDKKLDLVLLDPPYAHEELNSILQKLIDFDLLNESALIVCETDKRVSIDFGDESLELYKEKVYGASKITFFEWVNK